MVEHDLAKVGVASSSLVSRSSFSHEAPVRRGFVVSGRAAGRRVGGRGGRGFPSPFLLLSFAAHHAGIAQLVEHDLAKVGVASSSLVSRSSFIAVWPGGRVVMQRTANPRTPVRFRPRPPKCGRNTMKGNDFPVVALFAERDPTHTCKLPWREAQAHSLPTRPTNSEYGRWFNPRRRPIE